MDRLVNVTWSRSFRQLPAARSTSRLGVDQRVIRRRMLRIMAGGLSHLAAMRNPFREGTILQTIGVHRKAMEELRVI
jgi:hypothetical protein